MRFIYLLFILLLLHSTVVSCFGQNAKIITPDKTGDYPQVSAIEMPVYPGGEAQMQADLKKHIVYDKKEIKRIKSPRVYVRFIVEKDGTITDVEATRGIDNKPGLSKAAEEAVMKLQKWTPARQNGKAVRLTMTIPVIFSAD